MLSVVVIGKNEGKNLARLAKSVVRLVEACSFPIETIYVDSASEDDSVEIAHAYFDRVVELMPSDQLCASAGRYVGTIEARFPWVFYIDADMELCEQFFSVVEQLPNVDRNCCGVVGSYIHRFDNGSVAVQGFAGGVAKSEWAAQFGGAVILRRSDVLRVGNWTPGVFGKEELELYARLGKGKRVVRFVNVPMIYHYSEYFSKFELLLRLLYPAGGLGKVFHGYGQSIRSLQIRRKLTALIRLDFEPYLFWMFFILGMVLAVFLPMEWGLLLVAIEMLCLSMWMRPGSVMRYFCLALPLASGWTRFVPYFRPEVTRWASDEDKAS